MSRSLPHNWYETPNIRFFTLTDFTALLDELGLAAERTVTINGGGHVNGNARIGPWTNLLTEQAIFLIGRG